MTNDEAASAQDAGRYARHALIDWFSQDQVRGSRIAVIGAGAIGNEVVKNLVLLGTGTIDVFDFDRIELHNLTRAVFFRESDVGRSKAAVIAERAGLLDPNVQLRGVHGDFWDTLSLAALQRYDCAIACVDNFEARIRLNQLCGIAGVNLVNAGIDSRQVSVERFPFAAGSCACYECHLPQSAYARIADRYSCGGLKKRALAERKIPTTAITASIAGALAASTALRLGVNEATSAEAQRTLFDTLAGRSTTVSLGRQAGCVGCERLDPRPRIIRTRRSLAAALSPRDEAVADLTVDLSDPIIVDWTCTQCGGKDRAPMVERHRASDFDDAITLCERCRAHSAAVTIKERFSLAELESLYGKAGLPVKYLLAYLDSTTLCIDLEEDHDRTSEADRSHGRPDA